VFLRFDEDGIGVHFSTRCAEIDVSSAPTEAGAGGSVDLHDRAMLADGRLPAVAVDGWGDFTMALSR
jgi:hypothetical protein